MLKIDKIKIVSNIQNISNINEDKFTTIIKDGCITERKFTSLSPYLLYIEADLQEQELVIEFSSKILLNNYPHSINITNIRECLSTINTLGLCDLDINSIIEDGGVVKVDVCKDIDYNDCKGLCKSIRSSISNYRAYTAKLNGTNLTIDKTANTKSLKRRIIIYDKAKELKKATNRRFIESLTDKQAVLDHFNGKIRFEMNLNSKEQIRQCLKVTGTSVDVVLNTEADPIWDFLSEALDDGKISSKSRSLTEFKNLLLLQYCNNDLAKVEAVVREHCSPNTHISQVMKPYRELLTKVTEQPSSSVKDTLRKLLTEIVILIGIVSF